jgi:hypothetical protein
MQERQSGSPQAASTAAAESTAVYSADYVIIGSGAVGMAFADILVSESDATVVIVDRYAKPGGHWNVAYPFVELHQPAAFYGVSSKELSGGRSEPGGLNAGLGELATGAQVSAYFEDVMRYQFLPSGRVQYFPSCEYRGEGQCVSLVSGKQFSVQADKKFIDCTHLNTEVPSTHTPNFHVEDGVQFIPLNDLPRVTQAPEGYVVIGAGKTGIDACLWLLDRGVQADEITWIMPRDAWLLDRKNTQVTQEFFFDTMGAYASQMESLAAADSLDDLCARLEKSGYFLRIDENVTPTMFHAATISQAEIEALRRIRNVVRLGRVQTISPTQIVLEKGVINTSSKALHVDCSASAIGNVELKPIFDGDVITPQMVRPYQPVFSAALIAHVELNYAEQEQKNKLCAPVPLPNHVSDFLRFTAVALSNQFQWNQQPELREWIAENRLDGPSKLAQSVEPYEVDKLAVLQRIGNAVPAAAANLPKLLASL